MEYHYEIIPTSELPAAMTAPVRRAYDLCVQHWGITPELHFISPCRADEADLSEARSIHGLATTAGDLYVRFRDWDVMLGTFFHEYRHHIHFSESLNIKAALQVLEDDADNYGAKCTISFIEAYPKLCSRAKKASERYQKTKRKQKYTMNTLTKHFHHLKRIEDELQKRPKANVRDELLEIRDEILDDLEGFPNGENRAVSGDHTNAEGMADYLLDPNEPVTEKVKILNEMRSKMPDEHYEALLDVCEMVEKG